MEYITQFFPDPAKAALGAALICVALTTVCAYFLPKKTIRIFTALSLYALSWGMLVAYYAPKNVALSSNLLPAFNGFLLIYTGLLLKCETIGQKTEVEEVEVGDLLGGLGVKALTFFLSLVMSAPAYYLFSDKDKLLEDYHNPKNLLLGTLITIIGFAFVWFGIRRLYESSSKCMAVLIWMALLLLAYASVEINFIIGYWIKYGEWIAKFGASQKLLEENLHIIDMQDGYKYAFAVLKILFTVSFLPLVVFRPIPGQERKGILYEMKKKGVLKALFEFGSEKLNKFAGDSRPKKPKPNPDLGDKKGDKKNREKAAQ